MNTAMPIETLTPEEFAAKYLPILRGEDTPKANPLDSDAEVAHVLRRGSGFEGGKLRIAALYANDPSPADAAAFLRNEVTTVVQK